MNKKGIEEIAILAREILLQIPFSKEENINFRTVEYGDPMVMFEAREDGYFEVVNECGKKREYLVAHNEEEMVNYFVHEAIREFSFHYEMKHRREFESNLRQTHEIMEKCYQYIDKNKKMVQDSYEDTIHFYLGLLNFYQKTADRILQKEKDSSKIAGFKHLKYIAERLYCCKSGGMTDVALSCTVVRYHIDQITMENPSVASEFLVHEKEYEKLVAMEMENSNEPEKYQLGSLDDTLTEVEPLIERLYLGDFSEIHFEMEDSINEMLFRRVLMNINTERNLKSDVELFLQMIETMEPVGCEKEIRELFVENKYGVFSSFNEGSLELYRQALTHLKHQKVLTK